MEVNIQMSAKFVPQRPAGFEKLFEHILAVDRPHRRKELACRVIKQCVCGKKGARVMHLLDVTSPGKKCLPDRVDGSSPPYPLLSGSADGFTGSGVVEETGIAKVTAFQCGDG